MLILQFDDNAGVYQDCKNKGLYYWYDGEYKLLIEPEPLNLVGISPDSRTNKDTYTNLRSSCLPCTKDAMKLLFGSVIKSIITKLLPSESVYLVSLIIHLFISS